MDHWIGAQGQVKSAKKTQNISNYDVTHRESQTQIKKAFFNRNWKTFRIRRGFEQLSSSSGWRVMAKNVSAVIVAGAGVKG